MKGNILVWSGAAAPPDRQEAEGPDVWGAQIGLLPLAAAFVTAPDRRQPFGLVVVP